MWLISNFPVILLSGVAFADKIFLLASNPAMDCFLKTLAIISQKKTRLEIVSKKFYESIVFLDFRSSKVAGDYEQRSLLVNYKQNI